jgi:uncharacterized protein
MSKTNSPEIRVGLISDTHIPLVMETLPENVFTALQGSDVILHAGDVGDLWVLDELSQIAPVIAVHGNDESREAEEALPFLQTVSIAGHRIVITHGHYPDPAEEMAMRSDNTWESKLDRLADFARQHGASIVITGHTHIPMHICWDGVTIINPGTPLYGNGTGKQLIRTVAKLTLRGKGDFTVEHLDLNNGLQPIAPQLVVENGFRATRDWAMTSIVDPVLEIELRWFAVHVLPLAREAILERYYQIARQHWTGNLPLINASEMMRALHEDAAIPLPVFAKLRESEFFARHLP